MLNMDSTAKSAHDVLPKVPDASPDARAVPGNSASKQPSSPLVSSVTTKDLDESTAMNPRFSHQREPSNLDTPQFSQSVPTRFSQLSVIAEDQRRIAAQPPPQPYLPLRKKLTRSLKLGLGKTRPYPGGREQSTDVPTDESNGTSVADFAQRLRPRTSKSSQDSSGSPNGDDNAQSPQSTPPKESRNIPSVPQNLRTSLEERNPHESPLVPPTAPPPPKAEPPNSKAPPMLNLATAANDAVAPPQASPFVRPKTSTSDYASNSPATRHISAATPVPYGSSSPAVSEFPPNKRPPTYFQDGPAGSTRDSVRSAFTNNSSVPDLSSNGRTSGMTDRSSTSDAAFGNSDWSKEINEELTVEECIQMYARGFTDDPPTDDIPPIPEEPPSTNGSVPDQHDVPSMTASSAASEPMSPLPVTPSASADSPAPTAESEATTSTTRKTSATTSVASVVSGPGSKAARDHYGFKKETQHVKLQDYNSWHAGYLRYMERRRRKWVHLMNEAGLPSNNPQYFPGKSDKVKRYIRKGIPPEWRGAAWFFYADGASFITTNPGLYQQLVAKAGEGHLTDSDREHIERDLHRTLPENKHFKPDAFATESVTSGVPLQPESVNDPKETDMILSLRRILQAFAIHHPKVGYCQSLNFLAAHLLLFMRAAYPNENYEERAFVLLCILTERHLPGTHGVVLEGANVDIGVLMMFIQESMPGLWAKLDDKSEGTGTGSPAISRKGTAGLPTVSLATTAWFMSCFVSTLPVETTCRVWDCLWYEGSKTIFRVALAIFKLGERDIRRAKDPMEMFQVVQNLPRTLLDANTLMEIATKKRKVPMRTAGGDSVASRIGPNVGGFGGLSAKTVESRREERRQLTRRERERTTQISGMTPPPIPEEPTVAPSRSLSRSSSRSRLKRFKSMRKLVEG